MGQLNTGNYYEVLGVADNATEDAIKAAYRRLVLRHHPDKAVTPEAEAMFARIQKAYEVLGHPALREEYDRQLALNKEVAESYFNVPTRYTSHRISMHINKQTVRVGEPFTVIFRCPRKVEGFKLRGLEHFELLQSVEHEMPYQGVIITQVHYVLKALGEGAFTLGPASAISGNVEYVSGQTQVEAHGHYLQPTWAHRSWLGKYYPAILIGMAVLLPAFIFYNISVYGIRQPGMADEERYYPFGQRDNRLQTGDSPYHSAYNTANSHLYSGQIVVNNQQQKDVVLLLLDNDEVIVRNHYIRAGERLVVDNIKDDTYQWLLLTGQDWDPKKASVVEGYFGNFKNGTAIGSQQADLDAWHIWQKEADNTVFYSIYRIDLSGKEGEEVLSVKSDTGFYITKQ